MAGVNRLVIGLAAVTLLGFAGPVRGGETYRNAAHKYAIDLPDGWEARPWETSEFTWTRERGATKTATRVDDRGTTLCPIGAAGDKLPAAIIEALPHDRPDEVTFAEFEKVMTRVFTTRDRFGRSDLRTPLAFDEQRKRMVVQINDGERAAYAAGFFGKTEIVVILCAADRRSYPDHLPMFEKMVDSFRFEHPSAPAAPPAPPAFLERTFGPLGQTAQMAIVGGVVGVLVLVAGVLLMGRSPPRREPRF
jgi:hypothetical protein